MCMLYTRATACLSKTLNYCSLPVSAHLWSSDPSLARWLTSCMFLPYCIYTFLWDWISIAYSIAVAADLTACSMRSSTLRRAWRSIFPTSGSWWLADCSAARPPPFSSPRSRRGSCASTIAYVPIPTCIFTSSFFNNVLSDSRIARFHSAYTCSCALMLAAQVPRVAAYEHIRARHHWQLARCHRLRHRRPIRRRHLRLRVRLSSILDILHFEFPHWRLHAHNVILHTSNPEMAIHTTSVAFSFQFNCLFVFFFQMNDLCTVPSLSDLCFIFPIIE